MAKRIFSILFVLSLMMVMHFSLTACSITFAPTAMTGWTVFVYSLAIAAVFWVIAAVVVLVDRRTKKILVPFSLRALGV